MNPLPHFFRRRGFTVVELLIVVLIIGVFASFLVIKFNNNTEKSRITADYASMRNVERAADAYLADRASLIPPPGAAGAWQSEGTVYTSGMMSLDERAEFFRTLSESGLLPMMFGSTGPIDLSEYAQSSSGLGLLFTVVSGPATIDAGHILIPSSTGDVRVRIEQTGNSSYAPAAPVEMILSIALNNGAYGVVAAQVDG